MPEEILPSSYRCDCGHMLHFCENTVREARAASMKRTISLGEGDDAHAVVFRAGRMVSIDCPKRVRESGMAL